MWFSQKIITVFLYTAKQVIILIKIITITNYFLMGEYSFFPSIPCFLCSHENMTSVHKEDAWSCKIWYYKAETEALNDWSLMDKNWQQKVTSSIRTDMVYLGLTNDKFFLIYHESEIVCNQSYAWSNQHLKNPTHLI